MAKKKRGNGRVVRKRYVARLLREEEKAQLDANERAFTAMMKREGFTTQHITTPEGDQVVVTNLQQEEKHGSDKLEVKRHVGYLLHHLKSLPVQMTSLDTNRLTLLYFVVSALDLIGALDNIGDRKAIIDYVYAHQLVPSKHAGFAGLFLGRGYDASGSSTGDGNSYERGHVAMTYVALAILRILGDDYSRVNRKAITAGLADLQHPGGSFGPVAGGAEHDVRFVFCACAISTLLGDWSGVDKAKATQFVLQCQTYEGAFGQQPGQESHGGSTYCAVASLLLMGKLDDVPRRQQLIQWCMHRQVGGFQGRVNKPADSCYAFWVGAALSMLGVIDLADRDSLQAFNFKCQNMKYGGFSKYPGYPPDPLHTYMALAGLALQKQPGLASLHPALNISHRALGTK